MQIKSHFIAALLCLSPLFLNAQKCLPSVTTINGLSVNLHPYDNDGDDLSDFDAVVVRMSDLILRADDYCNAGPLTFAIRKSGTGIGMPTDTSVLFDCSELGTQLVEIWARNVAGLMNYSETYIIVQANTGECDTHIPVSTGCANDKATPEAFVLNGLAGPLRPGNNGGLLLSVSAHDLLHKPYDNCDDGLYQYRLRKSGTGHGVPQDTVITFDCSIDWETQLVELWMGDPAGNWNYSETYVIIEDNEGLCDTLPDPLPAGCNPDKTPPELLVYHGFSQGIVWESGGPVARVYAQDFIRVGRDKCHNNLGWRIAKDVWWGDLPPSKPPKDASASVAFDCSELGTQLVMIWLRDGAGNWAKARSYVIVEDNTGICGQGPGLKQPAVPAFKQEILSRYGGMPAQARLSRPVLQPSLIAWPNPATDGFTLQSRLEQEGAVRIALYDQTGRLVRVLADRWAEAGLFQAHYTREGLPAGLYRCVLQSGAGVQSLTLVLTQNGD